MITIQLPLTTSIKAATLVGAYLHGLGLEDYDVRTGDITDIDGMLDPGKTSLLHKIRRILAEAEMPW